MAVGRTSFIAGMKRIRFSATYPERLMHPLHQQIIDQPSITRAELLMWSPTADATTLIWCDGRQEATEQAIDAIDSLLVRDLVEDSVGTYAFLHQADYEFAAAVLDTIGRSRVIFLPPVVFLDTGEIRFEAVGEPAALSAFHEELSELGELIIKQVHEFKRQRSPPNLTDRQQAALDAATTVGYYEIPREGTVADIAGILDCSTSTAGELVRKAEATVIRTYTRTK